MKQYYKNKYAVSDKGARDLTKASFFSLLVNLLNMVPAFILMIFINQTILGNVTSSITYYVVVIITLIAMYVILSLEYDSLFSVTYKESASLRISLSKYLSKLPLSYFSKHDLTDLSQTIMGDVGAIEHAMSHAIPKLTAIWSFLILIGILLLIGNVKLGLAVIIPFAIALILQRVGSNMVIKGNQIYYDVMRAKSDSFQETIELQQEIKSFNLSDEQKENLYRQMEEGEKTHLKTEAWTIITVASSTFFTYTSMGIVLLVGTKMLIGGEISILYLIGYFLAAVKLRDTVESSLYFIMEAYFVIPRVNRISEIKNARVQEGKDVNLKNFSIELKNVSFSYEEDEKVLKDVSFTAKQGEVTALVGASGCGKSTILKLVSRLYDYDGGKIIIDGYDIKDISTKSLFEKTSIVFQDVTLFNTSVMENIRLGRKGASDEEVKEAARLANCMEFIEKMPDGFETKIGENGAELSGGERQRLSIARAFLKDAPILILDEIAASLDVDNEKKIQESLNKLIENKTVIIISHRLKAVENVDKIVVLDGGVVESQGKHGELVEKSRVYRNLIEKTAMAENFRY